MDAGPVSPLSDRDYEAINNALANLAQTGRAIQLALQAGIACDQEDEYCKATQAKLEALKKVYFPGRP
jgi:hypothetical protein